jgi:DNA-binding FrmR family transcriptional regulator
VSAATIVALIVAVIAFASLGQSQERTIPRDAYTIAADQMCIGAKRQIVAVENGGLGAGAAGARRLLPVVREWRSEFDARKVPPDRIEEARALDAALREVQLQIATLARIAADGGRKQILAQAEAANEASSEVEEAVAELGLSHCSRRTIGFSKE